MLNQKNYSSNDYTNIYFVWHLTADILNYIDSVDEKTVIKYPRDQGNGEALALLGLKAWILEVIGPHKHIFGFRGLIKDSFAAWVCTFEVSIDIPSA